MRTRIKVCGITRESDALDAAQHGVDAVGFIFWRPSARFVDFELAGLIAAALPAFVVPVGVFVNPSVAEVKQALRHLPTMTLQFHGDESPEFCAQFGRAYIKAARMRPGLDLLEYLSRHTRAAAWLIDAFDESTFGGTGTPFNWDLLPQAMARPWILSGGLTAENVGPAIAGLKPWAVDVSSGVETAKGIKSADKIAAFVSGVRDAGI
jgi:phosphoribosylanthranilate isomerase